MTNKDPTPKHLPQISSAGTHRNDNCGKTSNVDVLTAQSEKLDLSRNKETTSTRVLKSFACLETASCRCKLGIFC